MKSFFREKVWILQNGAKTTLHTVRHRQQLSRIWIPSSEPRKITFQFRLETASSSKDGAERKTCSQNVGKNDLHTIRVS